MNRRDDKDSGTGLFVFWWVLGLGVVLLFLYGSILIARQKAMEADLACQQEMSDDAAGRQAARACAERPGAARQRTQ